MPTERQALPDEAFRDAAIRERRRNVLVDAGAGTGKTTLIIDRVVEMVAPRDPSATAVPLDRLAVITFTRRAAGELRYRLRQRLLEGLRDAAADAIRLRRLREALGSIDTGYIGTIHSFADRLLRLRPVEAGISPGYEIAEDADDLVREVFERLVQAAERGTLAEEVPARRSWTVPLVEVEETIRTAQSSGLRMVTREHAYGAYFGVDFLVAKMIGSRDVRFVPAIDPDGVDELRTAAGRIVTEIGNPTTATRGGRWLRRVLPLLEEAKASTSLPVVFRRVREAILRLPDYKMGADFGGSGPEWKCFKQLRDGEWRAELLGRLDAYMGRRLARCQDAVTALYEQVKHERGVIDQLDLLMKLRDLLRGDRAVRAQFQSMFDHILVDEFQDTDPLQCEVVFFLGEEGTTASGWRDVVLRPGSVTVVGDPKQSIYRFRRADILTYAAAHERLSGQGALVGSLVTNFRSRPGLVGVVNARFERLLGAVAASGDRFDRESGTVRYERIAPSPSIPDARNPAVRILPYAGEGGSPLNAATGRGIEAAAIARYVRALVASGFLVRDQHGGQERLVRYGDVVVLAHVTSNVSLLLRELDRLGIRYSAHGGTLFLSSPTVRQYLLGLRAVSDRDDGVAQAALLRPPFFALDLLDVVSPRLPDEGQPEIHAAQGRLQAAKDVIQGLRRDRFLRPPTATAVDLIERTALGRSVVTGPNGSQALESLYEVAYQLAVLAAGRGLDFDGATAVMRGWVDTPVQLDPPEATDPHALRVMTIHQAKGLEFPVVVLWDGFAEEHGRVDGTWMVPRTEGGLALRMDGLKAEMPAGGHLLDLEQRLANGERQRLFYVAMTRARDLLVVPEPLLSKSGGKMLGSLMRDTPSDLVERVPEYRPDALPVWAEAGEVSAGEVVGDASIGVRLLAAGAAFDEEVGEASAPIAVPTAVTAVAHEIDVAEQGATGDDLPEGPLNRARKAAGSRYGTAFGSTVHRAIELGLTGGHGAVADWVAVASSENGLNEHLEEACGDVERALTVLRGLGVGSPGVVVRTEYPVCALESGGRMLVGNVDCLIDREGELIVLDFKTDRAPTGEPKPTEFPGYMRQVGLYSRIISRNGGLLPKAIRSGLLFAESGVILWAVPNA